MWKVHQHPVNRRLNSKEEFSAVSNDNGEECPSGGGIMCGREKTKMPPCTGDAWNAVGDCPGLQTK